MMNIIKLRHVFLALFMFLALSTASYSLQITTGGQNNEGITDEAGNFLWGTKEAGCLVQVIQINSGDGIIHAPTKIGGTTGGDTIIWVTFVGQDILGTVLGRFATSGEVTTTANSPIYVRAWNSVEAVNSTYYGNSEKYITFESDTTGYLWNINGTSNIPAFKTSVFMDNVSPGPVRNMSASQDASGDIFISWDPSLSADATGVVVRYSTSAFPTIESEGSLVQNIATNDARTIRHSGRTHLQGYYYSAFAYDGANNYSIPASSYEVSIDTLAPSVVGNGPTGGTVATINTISVTFDDAMNPDVTQASIEVYPSVGGSWTWSSGNKTVSRNVSLISATNYTVTVETGAVDDAGNHLASLFSWGFRTVAGNPPYFVDLKIGGWKIVSGEVISSRPKITAVVSDPELYGAGIVSAEIQADTNVHLFTPMEFSNYYTDGGINGTLDFRLPWTLGPGYHNIILRVWDIEGNITEEAAYGLRVGSGDLIDGKKVYNYPAEVESGKGTTIAYTLTEDADIQIFIIGMHASPIWKKKISAGAPGGTGGYNEVFWDGLDNFGNGIGSGLYPAWVVSDGKKVAEFNILVINRQSR